MKILLLSCSTGEGHNHCALAVKEALDADGHETSFLDMLHMFGDPGPLSFDKLLNRISSRTERMRPEGNSAVSCRGTSSYTRSTKRPSA